MNSQPTNDRYIYPDNSLKGLSWKQQVFRLLLGAVSDKKLLGIMQAVEATGRIRAENVIRARSGSMKRSLTDGATLEDFRTLGATGDDAKGFHNLLDLWEVEHTGKRIAECSLWQGAYLYWQALGAQTVVEIGRYKGGTSLVFLCAMHWSGTLYSIDPECKESDRTGRTGNHLARLIRLRACLQEHCRLPELVSIKAKSSAVRFSEDLPKGLVPDLIYIDGDHSFQAVTSDLCRYSRLAGPRTKILCDDYIDSSASGVRKAVTGFLQCRSGQSWQMKTVVDRLVHLEKGDRND